MKYSIQRNDPGHDTKEGGTFYGVGPDTAKKIDNDTYLTLLYIVKFGCDIPPGTSRPKTVAEGLNLIRSRVVQDADGDFGSFFARQ